jgi:hypothetical protein
LDLYSLEKEEKKDEMRESIKENFEILCKVYEKF